MHRRWIVLVAVVLAGCGGGEDVASGDAGGAESGNAEATLVVGSVTYAWSAEDATNCEIEGIFPASADFGVAPSQGGPGPWFQFIDRGDGGINFSALLDGEEYNGTGSGEAEIGSDGFTYSGSMGHEGEPVDVVLEVTC